MQLGSIRKKERCGKGGRGAEGGKNDIQSFGIGRVDVKDMRTTQGGNSIYKQKRRKGGTSELDGHSMMLGMIMGTLPPRREKKISHREREREGYYFIEMRISDDSVTVILTQNVISNLLEEKGKREGGEKRTVNSMSPTRRVVSSSST